VPLVFCLAGENSDLRMLELLIFQLRTGHVAGSQCHSAPTNANGQNTAVISSAQVVKRPHP